MLNGFIYCPRLFFYEWVDGVFAHSSDTIEGALRHETLGEKAETLGPAGGGGARTDPCPVLCTRRQRAGRRYRRRRA
jgi:CRISPR-associated protein Cas1